MILLIDNYDSFVHNLARYFRRLGCTTRVARNDEINSGDVVRLAPDAVVFSPGPCTPTEAGASLQIVRELHEKIPMLGVCLGHQTIAAAFGGAVVRAPQPMHGRSSRVLHDGAGVFLHAPNPLTVCRYHSLIVDEATLPDVLKVTARTEDRVIMGLRHRDLPIVGLQFHPESILTESGYALLAGFLEVAGIATPAPIPCAGAELQPARSVPFTLPPAPVTF